MSFVGRLGVFIGTGVVVVLVARYNRPSAAAARADSGAAATCGQRYHTARTAADTAALDPLRTMTKHGVAEHTCGELRLAGRTN